MLATQLGQPGFEGGQKLLALTFQPAVGQASHFGFQILLLAFDIDQPLGVLGMLTLPDVPNYLLSQFQHIRAWGHRFQQRFKALLDQITGDALAAEIAPFGRTPIIRVFTIATTAAAGRHRLVAGWTKHETAQRELFIEVFSGWGIAAQTEPHLNLLKSFHRDDRLVVRWAQ